MNKQHKSCLQIWREREMMWTQVHDNYNREIQKARAREFPIGTRVQFQHGVKWLDGVVQEHSSIIEDQISIKRSNGTVWRKEVHEVKLYENNP